MSLTPQNVRLIDDEGRVLDLDESTFGQIFLDHSHHKNHDGWFFGTWNPATLSTGEQLITVFTNASSADQIAAEGVARELHLVGRAGGTGGAGFMALYSQCSLDVNSLGTAFTPHRHNHVIGNTSVASCYLNPVLANTGTLVDYGDFGAGQTTGGEVREEDEHIIPPGETFAFVLESSANTNPCLIKTGHYEHARKR